MSTKKNTNYGKTKQLWLRTIEVFILYLFAVIDNFEKIINKKKKKTRKSWISPSWYVPNNVLRLMKLHVNSLYFWL